MASRGKRPKLKLTPPDPSEDRLQESIFHLLERILLPEEALATHFPAGGYHLTPAARARLYRIGLRRGWPDAFICYSFGRILWLEVKTATGTISPAQRENHLRLRALGHKVCVVRRVEDVIAALIEHEVPFKKVRLDGDWYAQTINQGDAPGSAAESPQSPPEAVEEAAHA